MTNKTYPAKVWLCNSKPKGRPYGKKDFRYCSCENCKKLELKKLKYAIGYQNCRCGKTHIVIYRPHWSNNECVSNRGHWNQKSIDN